MWDTDQIIEFVYCIRGIQIENIKSMRGSKNGRNKI